ncbi:MAG TPA: right-handed parallel beta-helix repeat-containing protein [Acidothermaceae bacterium]|jgi:parallel beta-helix repeat protein
MRVINAGASAGLLTAATLFATAAPASAHTGEPIVVVHPGESVQAAIDAAPPHGTVILTAGTYPENLLVTKPLTLRGVGAVRLVPPTSITTNRCTKDADANLPDGQLLPVGICVTGTLGGPADPGAGDLPSVVEPVADVHIASLEVDGFAAGIESDGTAGLVVTDFTANGDNDSIDSFYGTGTVLARITVTGATGYAAVSLQRSRDVRVTDCTFTANSGFGLSLLDTRGARVSANTFVDNAGGIAVVDTPAGESAGDVKIAGNTIERNDSYFPGDGSAPSVSGVGIALVGTVDSQVSGNHVLDNVPAVDAMFGGFGIGLFDATAITGGATADHNRVTGNRISGSPTDVLNASGGANNVIHGNEAS